VRFAGAGVGGRGAVAAEHLAGSPAGKAHEVGLAATVGEPGVGERVAELMRMQPRQAGLLAAAAHELLDAPRGQATALAKPQPWQMGVLVPVADAKVAIQRNGGLAPVGQGALAAALAQHQRHVQLQVQVDELEVGQLAPSDASLEP
jgi:hypothetical protein